MREGDQSVAELLLRIKNRDATALKELYERTAPRQLAIATRLLGRRDLAEEAIQDAYVSIWQKADNFRPGLGDATGWVTAIVRRRAIDRLRASPWLKREVDTGDLATLASEPVRSSNQAADNHVALQLCLEKLAPNVQTAIRLSYLYGLTHTELSQRLNIPLGTLKSRLRRGLMALKECLQA